MLGHGVGVSCGGTDFQASFARVKNDIDFAALHDGQGTSVAADFDNFGDGFGHGSPMRNLVDNRHTHREDHAHDADDEHNLDQCEGEGVVEEMASASCKECRPQAGAKMAAPWIPKN